MDLLTSPRLLPPPASPLDLVGFKTFLLLLLLLFVCACVCCAVAAILLEYSKGWWEEALAIWSLLPALHNKNRHTSTPVMDDKETGTEEEVGGGGGS